MIRIALSILLLSFSGGHVPQTWTQPIVIAHRGASGERPEHTRAAYDLAIDQGADMIEPDLVMTRDGVLVVRHENEISETTDVADHPEFSDRRTTRTIDGRAVTGWFTEDFTLAELKTLRTRERLATLRPGNTTYDGGEPILTFQEVIDIALEGSRRSGRVIGLAPEMKHPTHFASIGLDMPTALVTLLAANGLTSADAPVVVQCFEVEALRALDRRIDTPLLQLIAAGGGPIDRPDLSYAGMIMPEGLEQIATYVEAIGVDVTLIVPRDRTGAALAATPLVDRAHGAGLKIIAWTFRAENLFLATGDRRGDPTDPGYMAAHGDLGGMLRAFYALGVDGVFSDFPRLAVAAR